MKPVSLWKSGVPNVHESLTAWLGSLVVMMETDFPLSGAFVTIGVPSRQLVDCLEADATGPVSVRYLDDGRMVIAVGTRVDADMLRAEFASDLDLSLIMTSGSPEKVRGFIKNARLPHA